jgi:hypothetical protein
LRMEGLGVSFAFVWRLRGTLALEAQRAVTLPQVPHGRYKSTKRPGFQLWLLRSESGEMVLKWPLWKSDQVVSMPPALFLRMNSRWPGSHAWGARYRKFSIEKANGTIRAPCH